MSIAQIREVVAQPHLRTYLLGTFLSNIGTWVQRIAVGWLAFKLTDAAAWVGLVPLRKSGRS